MKEEIPKGARTAVEVLEPEVSNIIGTIPPWLTGQLIRNGPAKWELKHCTMNHLFDGYNMITKFEIQREAPGVVTYSSKFLQSEAYKKAEAVQKPVVSEYSTKSCCTDVKKSVIARMISTLIPEQTDNCPFICNTGMGENPVVIGDTGFMFELDRGSLDCISRHDPVKELGVHLQSSHPLVDDSGYTYNLGISVLSGAKWNVLRFPPASKCGSGSVKDSVKKCEILTTFPCRNKTLIPWLHSFGMSKNYIICIDQPSYFNAAKMIGCIFSKGFCPKDVNDWKPEYQNRFYYINKISKKVVKTEILSQPFFFYHIVNCCEEDNHLIIDVFCMPNFKLVENLTVENFRAGYKGSDKDSPTLQRFVIPLIDSDIKNCLENTNLVAIKSSATACRSGSKMILEPEVLCENRMEFSTFNKKFSGLPLRFIWASGAFAPSSINQEKIFKFDIENKKLITWQGLESQFVGEPTFVSSPNNNGEEDEGVIINVVSNVEEVEGRMDFILFLDAQTLVEIGRAYFKADIPGAMHGVFLQDN